MPLNFNSLTYSPVKLAAFFCLGPLFGVLLSRYEPPTWLDSYVPWVDLVTMVGGTGVLAGVLMLMSARLARLVITAASLFFLAALLVCVYETPSRAFIFFMGVILGLYALWHPGERFQLRLLARLNHSYLTGLALATAQFSIIIWFIGLNIGGMVKPITEIFTLLSVLVSFLTWIYWIQREAHRPVKAYGVFLVTLAAFAFVVLFSRENQDLLRMAGLWSIVIPVVGFLYVFTATSEIRARFSAFFERFFSNPESSIILTFLFLAVAGSLLLNLPVSSTSSQPGSFLDYLFTAVSAVCVTGLVVFDTPTHFTFLGQAIVLLLIQLGGLGIMFLSAFAILIVGSRLSVSQESTIQSLAGQSVKGAMVSTLRRVLVVTFVIELVGMVALSLSFLAAGQPWPQAIWQGVFTAISAFCNAGFALQSDSLISYQDNVGVLMTVSLLIIAGGLSPAFILLIPKLVKGALIPLEYRFVLLASAILLLGGTLIFSALEWRGVLGNLEPFDKILNAWFHAASTRTAGFNAIDTNKLSLASVFVTIVLMFIGGSPGGTAGGIKTTTFMILMATIVSTARGYPNVRAFSRMIPARTVFLASTVASVGILLGSGAYLVILLTQDMPPVVGLFEVVSAMGTVGLSIGGTPMLDEVGKVIIILCMFLGRIGPLTAIILLSRRQKSDTWILPHEDVVVT